MVEKPIEIKKRRRNILVCELQCKAGTLAWSNINNAEGKLLGKPVKYEAQANKEILRMVSIWFSGGCQNFVRLKVNCKGETIIPIVNDLFSSDGLIGDDVRYPFPIDQELSRGEEVTVHYINTDTAFDHTVVVTLEIEQRFRDTTEDDKGVPSAVLKHESKDEERTGTAKPPEPSKKPDIFSPFFKGTR